MKIRVKSAEGIAGLTNYFIILRILFITLKFADINWIQMNADNEFSSGFYLTEQKVA